MEKSASFISILNIKNSTLCQMYEVLVFETGYVDKA